MAQLDRYRELYPYAENFFKATDIIGLHKTEWAIRHLVTEIPRDKLIRAREAARLIEIPHGLTEILDDTIKGDGPLVYNTTRSSTELSLLGQASAALGEGEDSSSGSE